MLVDLHTHSTFSDGLLTIPRLVEIAKQKKIKMLALTDHDTVEGLPFFLKECFRKKIRAIGGIELSTQISGQELHLVGYNFNYHFPPLLKILARQQQKRLERAKIIIERFKNLGLFFNQQIVRALLRQPSVGKPHLGRAILKEKKNRLLLKKLFKFEGSLEDFINKFLEQPGQIGYVPKTKINSFTAINLIRRAGGRTVLAHPDLDLGDHSLARQLIKQLALAGLWGLENPRSRPRQKKFFQKLARQNNLILTYGSDTHDGKRMGIKISYDELQKLLMKFKINKPISI